MTNKRIMMPCGKHKGKYIHNLPNSYLLWIAENWKEDTVINKLICTEADKEYRFRKEHNILHRYED